MAALSGNASVSRDRLALTFGHFASSKQDILNLSRVDYHERQYAGSFCCQCRCGARHGALLGGRFQRRCPYVVGLYGEALFDKALASDSFSMITHRRHAGAHCPETDPSYSGFGGHVVVN